MQTLRLDPELQKRLQRAASLAGVSLSEFIRQAAAQRADAVLGFEPIVGNRYQHWYRKKCVTLSAA